MAVRSAGRLEIWLPCQAASRAERLDSRRRGSDDEGADELHRQRPRLRRTKSLVGRARRQRFVRPAKDRAADAGERSTSAVAPNALDRQFTADQPNRNWIADFTSVWTAEGWLYAAAVIDLF